VEPTRQRRRAACHHHDGARFTNALERMNFASHWRKWSWAARLASAIVLIDFAALVTLCIFAAATDMHVRAAFEVWGYLHWPGAAISEHFLPWPLRMLDPIPYGRLTLFFGGAFLQSAAIGWVIGKMIDLLRRRGDHAL
jgi:hypothetical protein